MKSNFIFSTLWGGFSSLCNSGRALRLLPLLGEDLMTHGWKPNTVSKNICNLPIEVVEKGKKIKSQFDPSFTLALRKYLMVHNTGGVIQTGTTHHWTIFVPWGRRGQSFSIQ